MIVGILLGVGLVVTAMQVVRASRQLRREAELSARDFARTFPGRCMICSYHYYGISYGHVDPNVPVEPHDCIEQPRANRRRAA